MSAASDPRAQRIVELRHLMVCVQDGSQTPDPEFEAFFESVAAIPIDADDAIDRIESLAKGSSDLLQTLFFSIGTPAGRPETPLRKGEDHEFYILRQLHSPAARLRMMIFDTPEDLDDLRLIANDRSLSDTQKIRRLINDHPAAAYLISETLWGGQHYGDFGRFYLRYWPHLPADTCLVIDNETNLPVYRSRTVNESIAFSSAINTDTDLAREFLDAHARKADAPEKFNDVIATVRAIGLQDAAKHDVQITEWTDQDDDGTF